MGIAVIGRGRGIFLLALFASLAAAPADLAQAETPPQRTITLEVYGSDPCPEAAADEIVVCARKPESERYRIPKKLREDPNRRPDEISWGSRVEEMEEVNRVTMPGSCSVVGAGGQSGCFQQMLRQWSNDKRTRATGR